MTDTVYDIVLYLYNSDSVHMRLDDVPEFITKQFVHDMCESHKSGKPYIAFLRNDLSAMRFLTTIVNYWCVMNTDGLDVTRLLCSQYGE